MIYFVTEFMFLFFKQYLLTSKNNNKTNQKKKKKQFIFVKGEVYQTQ